MSPAVIERKLALLKVYHSDLADYVNKGAPEADHYAVERLIHLCVEVMYDIASHWLAWKGFVHPDSYAEVFGESGRRGLLSEPLALRLTDAAKMRNLLVHVYEKVDWRRVVDALPAILADVASFLNEVTARLLTGRQTEQ